MSDNNTPTKKRKANDGRATVPDGGGVGGLFSTWLSYFSGRRDGTTPTASSTCGGENLTQMDRMENMMKRIEERQLVTMNSLERRCANLEAKCNSLENELGDVKKTQRKQFEYNSMLVRNQNWKYKTRVSSAVYLIMNGHNEDTAEFLSKRIYSLKEYTEKLRRGEFPDYHGNNEGIKLDWGEDGPILDYDAR